MQQLESSRLKLTQLEQELQRARQQVGLGYLSLHELCIQLVYLSIVLIRHIILILSPFLQGIFISSSGDQSHSMGGNGNNSFLEQFLVLLFYLLL